MTGHHKQTILIAGLGIAGLTAATECRKLYPHADITAITREPYTFYNRIAMLSYMSGKRRQEDMYFHRQDALSLQGIQELRHRRITAIHPEDKRITLNDGRPLSYDKLILATGARPFIPPITGATSDKVFALWDMASAQTARPFLKEATRVVIVGGGVLGVEAALDLTRAGQRVTLVETQPHILEKMLPESMSATVEKMMLQRDITILTQTRTDSIEQTTKGLNIGMSNGTGIIADVVLLTTGVVPDVRPAIDAGLAGTSGITVDQYLRTSNPHIWAAGNCIHQPSLPLLWNPAMIQGRTAATNLFENRQPITPYTVDNLFPIYLKNVEIPVYAQGNPMQIRRKGTLLEDTGSRRGHHWHRMLWIDDNHHIAYAAFVGRTDNCHLVEKAICNRWKVPRGRIEAGSVDDIVQSLAPVNRPSPYGWSCQMCGYVYEGDNAPEICPVCGVGRDQFLAA